MLSAAPSKCTHATGCRCDTLSISEEQADGQMMLSPSSKPPVTFTATLRACNMQASLAQVAAPTYGLKPGGEFCGLCIAAQSDGQMQPHLELVLDAASGQHTTPDNSCHHAPRFEMCDYGCGRCPYVQPLPCYQSRHSFAVLATVTAWPPETPAAAEVLAVSPAFNHISMQDEAVCSVATNLLRQLL